MRWLSLLVLILGLPFLLGGGPSPPGQGHYLKTVDPTVNDDVDLGFRIGAAWTNTTNDTDWVCLDNSDAAAGWKDRTAAAAGGSHPVVDTTSIVEGSADGTKEVRFEVDGFAGSAIRVLTMADQDIDLTPGTGSYATEAEGALAVTALQDLLDDTSPQLFAELDVNGQSLGTGTVELLDFIETAFAVNHVTIQNNIASSPPTIRAGGDDTDINLYRLVSSHWGKGFFL